MIRTIDIPGRYYLDAGVFTYRSKGARVPVWVDLEIDGNTFRAQPLRDGQPVGNPVTVTKRVLYRGAE